MKMMYCTVNWWLSGAATHRQLLMHFRGRTIVFHAELQIRQFLNFPLPVEQYVACANIPVDDTHLLQGM
jgi:hypothetical protein